METDKTLWTSPYNDPKYGEEQGSSFKYFKEFIKMDTPRDLVSFHEHISNILSNKGRKRKPSYKSIREYSAKWKWFMRAKAYDEYLQHKHDEELAEEIKQIREERIHMQKVRMKMQDKLLHQLMNDEEMATNQKIYGASKNSEAIRNETASLNDIVNEGKTNVNLDANVDADIQSEQSSEVKLKKIEEMQKHMDDMEYD